MERSKSNFRSRTATRFATVGRSLGRFTMLVLQRNAPVVTHRMQTSGILHSSGHSRCAAGPSCHACATRERAHVRASDYFVDVQHKAACRSSRNCDSAFSCRNRRHRRWFDSGNAPAHAASSVANVCDYGRPRARRQRQATFLTLPIATRVRRQMKNAVPVPMQRRPPAKNFSSTYTCHQVW